MSEDQKKLAERIKEYSKPKSLCSCGHYGDGPYSFHEANSIAEGHGKCTVVGCDCPKFTWVRFTDDFQLFLNGMELQTIPFYAYTLGIDESGLIY